MKSRINDIKLLDLPCFPEDNGELVVIEGLKIIPFEIARVFTVRAPFGALRGEHAHFNCTQFLVCTSGEIEVTCTDGLSEITFLLNHPSKGLLIPPLIWAKQNYIEEGAVLSVLCDRVYEENDYIRDFQSFINLINNK